jgi:hypothetical protein
MDEIVTELSKKVLTIGIEYLGPAAHKFFDRQTTGHMGGIPFDRIEKQHIERLAFWTGSSAKLIIDKDRAHEMAEKIMVLGK